MSINIKNVETEGYRTVCLKDVAGEGVKFVGWNVRRSCSGGLSP